MPGARLWERRGNDCDGNSKASIVTCQPLVPSQLALLRPKPVPWTLFPNSLCPKTEKGAAEKQVIPIKQDPFYKETETKVTGFLKLPNPKP